MIISEEVGAAKPDPAIFDAAFERLGRPPRAEVLLVGDSHLRHRRRPRLRPGHLLVQPQRRARPADATSTYEIRHLNELARLLL